MGVADLVPGISGGTMAFITGIYEDFIEALNNINQFTKKKFDFLLILISGFLFSILSFSKLLTYLLTNFNIELRSFFLGLILVSIIILYRSINQIRLIQVQYIFLLIFSILSSFMIFNMSSFEPKVTVLYIFLWETV